MTRQDVFDFVREQYGTEPDYPWESDAEDAVVRHKSNRKWFGLVMRVCLRHIGIASDDCADMINVKCDPVAIGSLIGQSGIYPAYHMNKNNWITIKLDEADAEQVKMLIDMSYSLTAPKRKR